MPSGRVWWSRLGLGVIIRPSWKIVPLATGEIELIIDPKQAFGTGHHATTHLLIEWLQCEAHRPVLDGNRQRRVGDGGVAARGRGGRGEDFDPVAIDCAREYAQLNGFDGRLTLAVREAQVERAEDSFLPPWSWRIWIDRRCCWLRIVCAAMRLAVRDCCCRACWSINGRRWRPPTPRAASM